MPLTTGSSSGELQSAWALCLSLHESGYVSQPVNSITNVLFSFVLQISRAGDRLVPLGIPLQSAGNMVGTENRVDETKTKTMFIDSKIKGIHEYTFNESRCGSYRVLYRVQSLVFIFPSLEKCRPI